jgi:hypothetical protein
MGLKMGENEFTMTTLIGGRAPRRINRNKSCGRANKKAYAYQVHSSSMEIE